MKKTYKKSSIKSIYFHFISSVNWVMLQGNLQILDQKNYFFFLYLKSLIKCNYRLLVWTEKISRKNLFNHVTPSRYNAISYFLQSTPHAFTRVTFFPSLRAGSCTEIILIRRCLHTSAVAHSSLTVFLSCAM